MKSFLITVLVLFSYAVSAMNLTCVTDTKYGDPVFSLISEFDENYLTGSELLELKNVEITTSQETVKFELMKKDELFKPKKNKNLNQFLFSLSARDEHFQGIIQSIRFSKYLEPLNITKKEDGTPTFSALLIGQRESEDRLSSFLLDCEAK